MPLPLAPWRVAPGRQGNAAGGLAPSNGNACMSFLFCISSLVGGGAERQVTLLAPELVRQGFRTDIAVVDPRPLPAALAGAGVGLHRIAASGNLDPRLVLGMVRVVRRVRPSCVVTLLTQMDVVGGVAALITRTPFVLFERSAPGDYPPGWRSLLRRGVARYSTAILANSRGGLGYWAPLTEGRPSALIANCVASEEVRASPLPDIGEAGLPDGAPLVVCVGRLTAQKNQASLIKAAPMLLRSHPEARIRLLGSGPDAADLRALAASEGVGHRVSFLGFSDEAWGWLRRADVCVMPSLYEGSPNVVWEAMAARTPVIVSDIPSHREFLDEGAAVFVDPLSPSSIAGAVSQVLSEPGAARLRAERAAQHAAERTVPRVASRLAGFLLAVAAGG